MSEDDIAPEEPKRPGVAKILLDVVKLTVSLSDADMPQARRAQAEAELLELAPAVRKSGLLRAFRIADPELREKVRLRADQSRGEDAAALSEANAKERGQKKQARLAAAEFGGDMAAEEKPTSELKPIKALREIVKAAVAFGKAEEDSEEQKAAGARALELAPIVAPLGLFRAFVVANPLLRKQLAAVVEIRRVNETRAA